ncbi:26S proteasome non-ATPase regulatory subunit 6-like [Hibiscus syriacus]|uniref:26S proteasome non-ATPase regulatory subunit 6-like n=1 Tax=Hibiscus syriacus TaxID=106335 RepID=UPI0019203ECF|nr:26S proteasome non-ATPase regulatory subunit 6-like [Hibiscus syriacus]
MPLQCCYPNAAEPCRYELKVILLPQRTEITDAEENLDESEVREAHLAKSLYYIRIGKKEEELEQLKVTESKTVVVGQNMYLVFYTLQIGLFYMDFDIISNSIDKAKNLFEGGVTGRGRTV